MLNNIVCFWCSNIVFESFIVIRFVVYCNEKSCHRHFLNVIYTSQSHSISDFVLVLCICFRNPCSCSSRAALHSRAACTFLLLLLKYMVEATVPTTIALLRPCIRLQLYKSCTILRIPQLRCLTQWQFDDASGSEPPPYDAPQCHVTEIGGGMTRMPVASSDHLTAARISPETTATEPLGG